MLINWDQPKVVLFFLGMWVLINLVVLIYMNLTLTYRLMNQFQWLSTNVDLRQTTIHPLESRCRPSNHLEVCPTGENGVPNLEPIYGLGVSINRGSTIAGWSISWKTLEITHGWWLGVARGLRKPMSTPEMQPTRLFRSWFRADDLG